MNGTGQMNNTDDVKRVTADLKRAAIFIPMNLFYLLSSMSIVPEK